MILRVIKIVVLCAFLRRLTLCISDAKTTVVDKNEKDKNKTTLYPNILEQKERDGVSLKLNFFLDI